MLLLGVYGMWMPALFTLVCATAVAAHQGVQWTGRIRFTSSFVSILLEQLKTASFILGELSVL